MKYLIFIFIFSSFDFSYAGRIDHSRQPTFKGRIVPPPSRRGVISFFKNIPFKIIGSQKRFLNDIERGDAVRINLYLENRIVDPNKANESGWTALQLASRAGHVEIVRLLLKDGRADPNKASDFKGETPLFLASRAGHVEIVRLLLKDGRTDPNKADKGGFVALHEVASDSINKDILRLLLKDERTDPNKANENGWTALHLASIREDVEIAEPLLKDERVDVNKTNNRGETPFHVASRGGVEFVKLFLKDERVDVNKTNKNGFTLFQSAALERNANIIELLLKDGRVDPQLTHERSGKTALHLASEEGSLEIVRLLLKDERVDVNKTDKDNNTPLDVAANEKVEKLLQSHGGKRLNKFNERSKTIGRTFFSEHSVETPQEAFFRYVVKGDIKKVEDFLAHKSVDPNKADQHGWTALHWALLGENAGVAELLLKDGRSDPNKADKEGVTPFHLTSRNESMKKLLLKDERVDSGAISKSRRSFIKRIRRMYHELRYVNPQKMELITINPLIPLHAQKVYQQMKERLDHPELLIYPMNLGTKDAPRYTLLEGSHRVTSASVMGRPVVLEKWDGQKSSPASTSTNDPSWQYQFIKNKSIEAESLGRIIEVVVVQKLSHTEKTSLLERVILKEGSTNEKKKIPREKRLRLHQKGSVF